MAATKNIPATKWPHPSASKSTLVIGDSNMRNLKQSPIRDIEIFGYPGASFGSITQVLKRTPSSGTPKQVILALGINMRNKAISTIMDQFRKLTYQASQTFPNAQINIPLINYSEKLTNVEKDKLDFLNKHIRQFFDKQDSSNKYLNSIPSQEFKTGPDNIHITKETGNKLLKSWIQDLN